MAFTLAFGSPTESPGLSQLSACSLGKYEYKALTTSLTFNLNSPFMQLIHR